MLKQWQLWSHLMGKLCNVIITQQDQMKSFRKGGAAFFCCYVMGILYLWPRFSVNWLHRAVDIWEGNVALRGGWGGPGGELQRVLILDWSIDWLHGEEEAQLEREASGRSGVSRRRQSGGRRRQLECEGPLPGKLLKSSHFLRRLCLWCALNSRTVLIFR